MKIKILSHDLNEVYLEGFFYEPNYGWCIQWYDNEEERVIDCQTYGKFPQDFVETETSFESDITKFLDKQPKIDLEEIEINDFFKWLQTNSK